MVFWGPIHSAVVTPFADAVNDVPPDHPLDLMLTSLGGDAEAAIRMAAMCHAGRDDFRVIVPDTAASAATLLALAAESVVMSDTSALGPVDPQILLPRRDQYFPAKGIVEIVNDLDERTRDNPQALGLISGVSQRSRLGTYTRGYTARVSGSDSPSPTSDRPCSRACGSVGAARSVCRCCS